MAQLKDTIITGNLTVSGQLGSIVDISSDFSTTDTNEGIVNLIQAIKCGHIIELTIVATKIISTQNFFTTCVNINNSNYYPAAGSALATGSQAGHSYIVSTIFDSTEHDITIQITDPQATIPINTACIVKVMYLSVE